MPDKILVVDDDIDTLRSVGMMLQRQGYQIIAANNGHQALIMAQNEKPDLVLLDVMMPDLDGYDVTRRLRSNPTTSGIPIIMLTAKTMVEDKVLGYEVGADDYLTKPTQPRELFAHIKAVLARGKKAIPTVSAQVALPKAHGYTIGVVREPEKRRRRHDEEPRRACGGEAGVGGVPLRNRPSARARADGPVAGARAAALLGLAHEPAVAALPGYGRGAAGDRRVARPP